MIIEYINNDTDNEFNTEIHQYKNNKHFMTYFTFSFKRFLINFTGDNQWRSTTKTRGSP